MKKSTEQMADRIREVILNGYWIANTNFRDLLSDISCEEATIKIGSLNSIAVLTFHIHYYIEGILNFFETGNLDIRDKYSFDSPPIKSQKDWSTLTNKLWNDSEILAKKVEQMPNESLNDVFVEEKYGSIQRNLDALIEHSYYHLGQISLLKKLLSIQLLDK